MGGVKEVDRVRNFIGRGEEGGGGYDDGFCVRLRQDVVIHVM